jgi:hypothetical protein
VDTNAGGNPALPERIRPIGTPSAPRDGRIPASRERVMRFIAISLFLPRLKNDSHTKSAGEEEKIVD